MQQTYSVTGMTCNGCKTSVEKKLSAIPDVTKAYVDLEKKEATIDMSRSISITELQSVLPEKFLITEQNTFQNNQQIFENEKSDYKKLFPLFLIFGYILSASILLNYKTWGVDAFMLDFMGLFYIVFSFFKLLDLKGFPDSFKMYDPLAKVVPVYAWIYPFIEVFLGVLFLMRIAVLEALVITLVILGLTTYGVIKVLLDKKSIRCACLGTALKLPMTKATFIENSIMIIMAVVMLIKTYY